MSIDMNEWKLLPGIVMSEEAAIEAAKVACALKSLAIYTSLMIDREDCPEDLKETVEEGVAAINKLFA